MTFLYIFITYTKRKLISLVTTPVISSLFYWQFQVTILCMQPTVALNSRLYIKQSMSSCTRNKSKVYLCNIIMFNQRYLFDSVCTMHRKKIVFLFFV